MKKSPSDAPSRLSEPPLPTGRDLVELFARNVRRVQREESPGNRAAFAASIGMKKQSLYNALDPDKREGFSSIETWGDRMNAAGRSAYELIQEAPVEREFDVLDEQIALALARVKTETKVFLLRLLRSLIDDGTAASDRDMWLANLLRDIDDADEADVRAVSHLLARSAEEARRQQ